MSLAPCILAIDQGTTSSRAMAFDGAGEVIAIAQQEFPQIYPHGGWVEHDPEAIWSSVLAVARTALQTAEDRGFRVRAVGIANQRETTLLWERDSGKPIHNAIVWQDRRTASLCRELADEASIREVQSRSGLLIDPYFSATKINWLLDRIPDARQRAERGELMFGTVDSFLIWRLTGGRVHATDATNASRTNLFNIHRQQWDEELLRLFNVPSGILPEVLDSAADYGVVDPSLLGRAIPIRGVAGDQQAAAIGQCCFRPGQIKSTYGTGCFVLMNTGAEAIASKHRLLTTVGYRLDGKVSYALEGSIFVAGAAVKWLRDGLGLISSAAETARLASSLTNNAGLYLVPAFAGLGAPWWDPDARGAIFGLTQATGPAEFARAALESVCYQTFDLFDAVGDDSRNPDVLRVDGGMVDNDWLMQFLADILDMPVERPAIKETTALGAAYLAGMETGLYDGIEQLEGLWRREARFTPQCDPQQRRRLLAGWHDAVGRVLSQPHTGAGAVRGSGPRY